MATAEQTMMKVQRLLTQAMGLRVNITGDSYWVDFNDTSTSVRINVREWGEDTDGEPQSLVLVESMILHSVKPTPALFEWVARKGGSGWFGHVEVRDHDDGGLVYLMMSHTLLGDYLDEKELDVALWSILMSADRLDDELQKQFGGKKTKDD